MSNICIEEGCKYPFINKKYKLCDHHNYIRLNGRSKQEVYEERHKDKPIKRYAIKSYSRPRQQTDKQKEIKQLLHQVKSDLELEAIHDNRYYCWSCGHSQPGLDKSHILSVKHRPDMELMKENINLFCRSCHEDWESGNAYRMVKSLTFESDLNFIMHHDLGTYGVIIGKLQHAVKWGDLEDKNVKKMQNILKIFREIVA